MANLKTKIILLVGSEKITNQTEVSKLLKLPLTTVNYHFKKLYENKILTQNNKLTAKGRQEYNFLIHWDKNYTQKLRAHKIQLTLKIQKMPDFNNFLKNKIFSPFTNKKYKGLKTEIENSTLLIYNNSKAVICLPDIYANTNEEIITQIQFSINQIIEILKTEFKIIVSDYEIGKFSSMHIAIPNSLIAQNYILEKKCILTANHGFSVDNSHGKPELEIENLENIFEKTEIIMKYEDLVRENENLKAIISALEINQL